MRVLQAKTNRPLDLLAISSGGHVATASSAFGVRGDVEVWVIATGGPWYTYRGHEREVASLTFHPDGQRLFVGEESSISVLDVGTKTGAFGEEFDLGEFDLVFPQLVLSADGTRLLVATGTNNWGVIELRIVTSDKLFPIDAEPVWSERPQEYVLYGEPSISPDGKRVAVSVHEGFRDHVANNVQLRDAGTGKVIAEVEFGASNPLEQIVFSADGSKVLARSSGRTVKVFDAATGQPAGEIVHPGRPYVTGMAVHPSGTVACSRNNGTICLWEPAKHTLARVLDWKLGKLVSVAFSPDGSIGAAGTEDGQVVVWDVDV